MTQFLVGWDGSAPSEAAVEWAGRFAAVGDTVHVATVVPEKLRESTFLSLILPDIDLGDLVKPETFLGQAKKRIEERCSKLDSKAKVQAHALSGDPTDALMQFVEKNGVDHLVVGFKSYEREVADGIGHVAERLARNAPCTVTIVRPRP